MPKRKLSSAKKAKGSPAKKAKKSSSASGASGVVDRILPNAEDYAVFEDYHVKLMQTNVGDNNNKFYIIQVVQKGSKFFCWTRWGRLGENGQNKLADSKSEADAIKMFSKKFKDKTKNKWEERDNFVKHKGKYQIVETTDEEDGGDDEDAALGRLTAEQIKKGLAVLEQIKKKLAKKGKGSKSSITDLSSQFYSLVPTKSGRVRPPLINNKQIVGEKKAMLEFWLRMGFEDMKVDNLGPIAGILDLPLPKTLQDAVSKLYVGVGGAISTGAQMASRRAGNPIKKMDKELYGTILLYTGSFYSPLNSSLRSGDRKKVLPYYQYLRLFFEAMSCMKQNKRTLWRGISVDVFDEYEVGKVITWWSISSVTSAESVARAFMRSCGGSCTFFTIECKTAIDISAMSFCPGEQESLLAPGTKLKIISRKRNGNVTEIHAKEVGQAIS